MRAVDETRSIAGGGGAPCARIAIGSCVTETGRKSKIGPDTASYSRGLPFYHPTFEEGLKSALREICDAVHSPLPRDRDEGAPAGG